MSMFPSSFEAISFFSEEIFLPQPHNESHYGTNKSSGQKAEAAAVAKSSSVEVLSYFSDEMFLPLSRSSSGSEQQRLKQQQQPAKPLLLLQQSSSRIKPFLSFSRSLHSYDGLRLFEFLNL